jgi:hypothetical protein
MGDHGLHATATATAPLYGKLSDMYGGGGSLS